jgi:fibronectin-binding autotransporter adhesin
MLGRQIRGLISNIFGLALHRLFRRHGGVAMIFALSAPVLVAATGLSVDVGYWFQNQTSLQSAADAASLAAAMNDSRLGQTTSSTKASAALPYAQAAADSATNSQFGFASGAPGTNLTLTDNVGSATTSNGITTSTITYTATAQVPRPVFFAGVKGMGLSGLTSGSQSARATASVVTNVTSSSGGCLVALGQSGTDISATGGATITATNCGVVSDSTASCGGSGKSLTGSIALNPSSSITASSVSAAGCINVNTNGGASIKSTSGGSLTYGTSGESDPYAALSAAGLPPWPSMPTAPALSNTFTSTKTSPCGLTSANNSSSIVLAPCNYPSGISYGSGYSLELTSGDNNNTYDSTYTVSGGIDFTSGLTGNGKIDDYSQSNSSVPVPITIYATGAATTTKGTTTVNGFALSFEDPSDSVLPLSSGSGIFYLNGGMISDGSNTALTIGKSTFLTSSNSSGGAAGVSSGEGAMYLQEGTTTFSGGTFYFDGGLVIGGSAKVIFGPGIYYFRNGNFSVQNGGSLTANNATFVLEGTASYQFNGGTALNLSAPVANSSTNPTNCVLPYSSSGTTGTPYPQPTYSLSPIASSPTSGTINATNSGTTGQPATPFPWDGTNAKGICGILIYQTQDDSATDAITEGSSSYVNGVIYTPSAALNLSGSGSMQAANNSDGSTGTLAIVANSYSLTGSASITTSVGTQTGEQVGNSSTTTTAILLTQ